MRLKRLFAMAMVQALGIALLPAQPVPVLALTGGTLIDVNNWGDSARDLHDAVILISGGRISEVGPATSVMVPKGAQIIDCTGKFILPGLVDGYAGLNSQAQANADLYMGVTTVVARADAKRGFIDLGVSPGPHIYAIDTVGTTDDWSLLARRPEWVDKLREGPRQMELSLEDTGRQMVDTAHLGTRVLLIGPVVTAANAQLIISRAKDLHIVTYGDLVATPDRVGDEAGVDVLVHLDHYTLGAIPDELQRPLTTDPLGPAASTAFDYAQHVPATDARLRTYAHFLATHHAALLPTFSMEYAALPNHRNLWKEPAASLLDPARMDHPTNPSTGEMEYPLSGWTKHLPATGQHYMQGRAQKDAQQEALRVWHINETIFAAFPHYLAGSGADSMGTMPGISLHTELELLVRLGLSPREALAAATNNYAMQFGWTELGLIAPGRRADVLVVDGDPTENVWHARDISVLIEDGNIIDRNALLRAKH
jgi:Amidohydrolase family